MSLLGLAQATSRRSRTLPRAPNGSSSSSSARGGGKRAPVKEEEEEMRKLMETMGRLVLSTSVKADTALGALMDVLRSAGEGRHGVGGRQQDRRVHQEQAPRLRRTDEEHGEERQADGRTATHKSLGRSGCLGEHARRGRDDRRAQEGSERSHAGETRRQSHDDRTGSEILSVAEGISERLGETRSKSRVLGGVQSGMQGVGSAEEDHCIEEEKRAEARKSASQCTAEELHNADAEHGHVAGESSGDGGLKLRRIRQKRRLTKEEERLHEERREVKIKRSGLCFITVGTKKVMKKQKPKRERKVRVRAQISEDALMTNERSSMIEPVLAGLV
eukprot:TRINITY_DN20344_c0_g1_i1.p1 TRINITY_DN20344_c0_g1~~TRINITY_DN20344_c0_g1_i1.p1  ORF type:complete len:332 (-),score=63.53 TRINITY_DN20344_c0_g1_i1:58-1053(-)